MKTTKKLLVVVSVLTVLVGISGTASAKSSWEDFFTRDEAKTIKNMVKESIIHEFENPDGDWKKLISSKMIKNGAIDAEKVGDEIVKQKIFSATAPNSAAGADFSVCDSVDTDECSYYDDVTIPEIDVSKAVDAYVIYEVDDANWKSDTGFGVTYQFMNNIKIRSGHVYVPYGHGDNGVYDGTFTDYRVIVNY